MSTWLLVTIYIGLGILIVLGELCRQAFTKDSELEKMGAWDSINYILNLPLYVICWPLLLVLVWFTRRQKKAAQLKDAPSPGAQNSTCDSGI